MILGNLLLKRQSITYLLRFLFPTDAAAPLTSPETEIGTIEYVDVANALSKSGGKLVFTAPAAAAAQVVETAGMTKSAGLAVKYLARLTAVSARFGWSTTKAAAQVENGLLLNSASAQFALDGGAAVNNVLFDLVNDNVVVVVIHRTAGNLILVSDAVDYGTYPTMTLAWVGTVDTTTPTWMKLRANSTNVAQTIDEIAVVQLPAPYNTDYGIVTQRVASPVTGETATATANAIIEFTWTVATSETLEFQFRRTDDNNCWILRCDQAGGTIKLFEKVAGVETERDTGKTQTWTNTTAYRIVIIAHGNIIVTTVNRVNKHLYSSASFNNTATGVKVSGFATGSNLITWPRGVTLSVPFESAALPAAFANQYATVGDSVTWTGEFQPYLTDYLEAAQAIGWTESKRLAYSGLVAGSIATSMTADLALTDSATIHPAYVLINAGKNDLHLTNGAYETTYTNAMVSILKQCRTKWASARLIVMRPWGIGFDTEADLLATWIANAIATVNAIPNSQNRAELGPDERIFLENGDNGATYMADALHPTTGDGGGYDLIAQEWKIAMGY